MAFEMSEELKIKRWLEFLNQFKTAGEQNFICKIYC